MKTSLDLHDDHQYSIMQRVIDGTLAVDSVEEFKEILKIYPEDPLLQRKYADLLMNKSLLDDAQEAFHRASLLFIDQEMNMQAIVAKILQWSIQKPTHDEGKQFHKLLSQKGAQHTPLQRFWAGMAYGELVTLMLRLVRVKLSTGQKIACVDEPANDIYFVVSGMLAESISPDCQFEASKAGLETEPVLLGPNDIIGNVFPLGQTTISYTDVVAVNEAELVKIAKPVLSDACRKFSNIERLLHGIYKPENVDKCGRAWQSVRRSVRFGLPTKVEIWTPADGNSDKPDSHTGIAVDLSLGGVCVDLGANLQNSTNEISKGRAIMVSLDLLNEVATVQLTGKIVWQRHQKREKGLSMFIGIRFDSMEGADRELLTEYCSGSVGEQNLLWSLWDSLVKPDNS